jgi:hypothetical protein
MNDKPTDFAKATEPAPSTRKPLPPTMRGKPMNVPRRTVFGLSAGTLPPKQPEPGSGWSQETGERGADTRKRALVATLTVALSLRHQFVFDLTLLQHFGQHCHLMLKILQFCAESPHLRCCHYRIERLVLRLELAQLKDRC